MEENYKGLLIKNPQNLTELLKKNWKTLLLDPKSALSFNGTKFPDFEEEKQKDYLYVQPTTPSSRWP